MLQQPLVGAVPPPVKKGAQATALWGSGCVPSPRITLALSGWIRASTGASGAWEGTVQHSRGGKLQPDAHPGRAVSVLGKMFTQRMMSYFLCVQLGGGRVRHWSTQRTALAAAVAWARVCGHRASHSDLVRGPAILTWSSMPSALCPQPDLSSAGWWGWQPASSSACARLEGRQGGSCAEEQAQGKRSLKIRGVPTGARKTVKGLAKPSRPLPQHHQRGSKQL